MKIQAQQRLPVFIALSLAFHLVWFVNQQSWSLKPAQQDISQMAIHISESQAVVKKTVMPKPDAPAKQRPSDHSQDSKQQTETHQQEFNQLSQAKILGHIRQKLVQHFEYPRLARRRGWQGQVLLGFQIDHAGSIQHIHIKQSSGYAILDNSAIAALSKLGKVENSSIGLVKQTWRLEIPIIYRLES